MSALSLFSITCTFDPLAQLPRERGEAGPLTSWGTGVLFATIAIIGVPLDFTEVCKKLEGWREDKEAGAWVSR